MSQTPPSSRRLLVLALLTGALVGAAAVGYLGWQADRNKHQLAEFERPLVERGLTEIPVEQVVPVVALSDEEPRFVNVTEIAGLTHVQDTNSLQDLGRSAQTGGAAAFDYDNDGWTDLFITRLDSTPILYRNLGPDAEGTVRFKDETALAGLEMPATGSNGIAAADLDRDGHVDLFVTTTYQSRYFLFMNQGDGTFHEQAIERNAAMPLTKVQHYGHSASAGDYDGDGYLDLAICEWGVDPVEDQVGFRLLHNLGASRPGYFVDVTRSAGIVTDLDPDPAKKRPLDWSFTARFTDLDQDGRIDLAIASDYGTSRLFWNNGDGTFTDGTEDGGLNIGTNEMGSSIADFDGDGQLDWFVTSIHYGPPDHPDQGNRLYRNEGDRTFTERAMDIGVGMSGWGWGTAFFDYDNDADLDLVATDGFPQAGRFDQDQTRLWRNNGEGRQNTTFTDVSDPSGITDTAQGRGIVIFDYDRDGDLDFYVSNYRDRGILYRNDGGSRMNWLRLSLTGHISNRQGANALVTVSDPRLKWPLIWEHSLGSNFLSQSEPYVHFGLGSIADRVQAVTIKWPSGHVQRFTDVPVKTLLHVTEDEPEGVTVDPAQAEPADRTAPPVPSGEAAPHRSAAAGPAR